MRVQRSGLLAVAASQDLLRGQHFWCRPTIDHHQVHWLWSVFTS
jgi:hypothetical protein